MKTAVPFQKNTYVYQESSFNYLTFGTGEILLLALPGYANEADLFLKIAPALVDKYTVIALDLPWHGDTQIADKSFRKEDFIQVLKGICACFPEKNRVELMGYSYGARLSLGIFSKLNIQRLWLIAGDGLEARRGYNFFPVSLRRLIGRALKNPKSFLLTLDFLRKLRLVPKYTHRFMTHHLGNEFNRKRLFETWIFTAEFVSNPKKILQDLQIAKIPVTIIYGRNDKIIQPKGGLDLSQKYSLAKVYFVNTGHKIFGQELTDAIQRRL